MDTGGEAVEVLVTDRAPPLSGISVIPWSLGESQHHPSKHQNGEREGCSLVQPQPHLGARHTQLGTRALTPEGTPRGLQDLVSVEVCKWGPVQPCRPGEDERIYVSPGRIHVHPHVQSGVCACEGVPCRRTPRLPCPFPVEGPCLCAIMLALLAALPGWVSSWALAFFGQTSVSVRPSNGQEAALDWHMGRAAITGGKQPWSLLCLPHGQGSNGIADNDPHYSTGLGGGGGGTWQGHSVW